MIVEHDGGRLEKINNALNSHLDLKVVSAVTKRETAIKQLSLAPKIIMLNPDILKQRTLSRFLRSLQTKLPESRVMVIHDERPSDDILIDEIKLGVRGYVKSTDSPDHMIKAVRAVAAGEIWVERRVLEKTVERQMLLPDSLRAKVPDLDPLTSREMDMLNMVLQGSTNREIAEQSHISERTVKTHLYRVYRKLKVKSRAKAIALLSHS